MAKTIPGNQKAQLDRKTIRAISDVAGGIYTELQDSKIWNRSRASLWRSSRSTMARTLQGE